MTPKKEGICLQLKILFPRLTLLLTDLGGEGKGQGHKDIFKQFWAKIPSGSVTEGMTVVEMVAVHGVSLTTPHNRSYFTLAGHQSTRAPECPIC